MDNRTQHCPRCTYLSFDGATCWNNDCNYPSHESTNARNRRKAAELAEKNRLRREAEHSAKAAKSSSKSKGRDRPSDRWETIGNLLALAGGGAGVWTGVQSVPDTPWLWIVFAFVGAGLAYHLRKLIVVGGGILLGLYLVGSSPDQEPSDAPEDYSANLLEDPTVSLPGPPAEAPDARVIGLCVHNATTSVQQFGFAGAGDIELKVNVEPNGYHSIWLTDPDAKVESFLIADPSGMGWTATTAAVAVSAFDKDTIAQEVSCHDRTFPVYRLSVNPHGKFEMIALQ